MEREETIIDIRNLVTCIRGQIIHDGLDLQVHRGEILGVVGGSGAGKTVLLRTILGLMGEDSGSVEFFGVNNRESIANSELQSRSGVMFQGGALFSSLTVGENIRVPMFELTEMPFELAEELTYLKLAMVGLPLEAADKYPAELSGGMVKRAALARALALDAEILFLDEPTSGLDPISAEGFDMLLKKLQRNLRLTVVMITHDLDSLYSLCDRIAVLVDKKLIVGTPEMLEKHSHPWIKSYFGGARSRAVLDKTKKQK